MRRRDIEQHNLIRARCRMTMRQLRRIARVDDVDKLNPLDDAPRAYVQAGDNSFGQHESTLLSFCQPMLQLEKILQYAQPESPQTSPDETCTPITFPRSTAAVKSPP